MNRAQISGSLIWGKPTEAGVWESTKPTIRPLRWKEQERGHRGTGSSADSTELPVPGADVTKVSRPRANPFDLGGFGWGTWTTSSSGKTSVHPDLTLVALLSVAIWSWASRWWRVRLHTRHRGDRSAYCSTRGLFIISRRGVASGWCGPFLSLTGGSITALICHPPLALMCESKTCCAY